jgi:DNA-binding response OmpR family regulator
MGQYFYEQNARATHAAQVSSARVLIIGEDASAAAALSATLRTASHTVVAVTSASEALVLCATQTFQLAIIDEQLSGLSGIELARALRDAHALPAVFLSSCNDQALIAAAIEVGSLGLIVKPLDSTRLLPALQHVLSRAQELRELHAFATKPLQANESASVKYLKLGESIPANSLMKRLRRWHQHAFTITSKLLSTSDTRDDFYTTISRSRKIRHELRARRLEKTPDNNC